MRRPSKGETPGYSYSTDQLEETYRRLLSACQGDAVRALEALVTQVQSMPDPPSGIPGVDDLPSPRMDAMNLMNTEKNTGNITEQVRTRLVRALTKGNLDLRKVRQREHSEGIRRRKEEPNERARPVRILWQKTDTTDNEES